MIKLGLAAVFATALSASTVASAKDRLTQVFASDLIANGVAKTLDGRLFLSVQPRPGKGDPQVIEIRDGKPIPYPSAAWNAWRQGDPGHAQFVGVNALRIGPDRALWVVDRGAPGLGKPLVAGGVKLVRIDVATNKVSRIYNLAAVTTSKSFVDDVRFNEGHAYLTDAGQPGLIVLDLVTGKGRRVLESDPSTIAQTKLIA